MITIFDINCNQFMIALGEIKENIFIPNDELRSSQKTCPKHFIKKLKPISIRI